jgi:hypothetical protein
VQRISSTLVSVRQNQQVDFPCDRLRPILVDEHPFHQQNPTEFITAIPQAAPMMAHQLTADFDSSDEDDLFTND